MSWMIKKVDLSINYEIGVNNIFTIYLPYDGWRFKGKYNKDFIVHTTILSWCCLLNRSIKTIFTEIIFAIKDFLMNENVLFYSKLHYASHYHHNSLFFSNLKINGPEKNYDCVWMWCPRRNKFSFYITN